MGEISAIAPTPPPGFTLDNPVPPPGAVLNTDTGTESSLVSRMRQHYDERRMQATDIFERYSKDEQGLSDTALQLVGKIGVGGYLDFLGEAVITGAKNLVSALPDQIEDPMKRKLAEAGVAFLQTDVALAGMEAARKGMDSYHTWAEANPVNAANLESVVNIGLLTMPAKKSPLGKASAATERAAVRKSMRTKRGFVEELVTPKQTMAVKREQVARTVEQGLLRKGKVALTKQQQESANELMRLAVKPTRSLQKNYEIISDAVRKETDSLITRIRTQGKSGKVDKAKLINELDAAMVRIEAEPAIVGSSKVAARKVIGRMKQEIAEVGDHASDILKARKSFDNKFIVQGREALLDPSMENAMTMAIRESRRTVNGFLDDAVPAVGVRDSLRRQTRMLNVLDDLKVKAAAEADSAISRAYNKALHALTLRGQLNQTAAAIFGVGGLGAAAMFAPIILAGGVASGVAYAGGKVLMSPAMRRELSSLLRTGVAGADRAVIRDLIQMSVQPMEFED